MSRREGRESDSKRHRSRFDREPSPKRSRRDGKPATERPSINPDLDTGNNSNRDEKHRRRLQDALPLEVPVAPDSKVETRSLSKESDKKPNGHREGTKNSSDPAEIPRSRSYFQHDERGNAAQVGRSFSRRTTTERGWSDSKDRHSERATNRPVTSDAQQKDEKAQARKVDDRVWRHDGFFEVEADPHPPARKRPSFRERKIPVDSENTEKAGTDTVKPSRPDNPVLGSERKEERGGNKPRPSDRPEKTFAGDREANREEAQRGGFPSRDRYGEANREEAQRGGFLSRDSDRDRYGGGGNYRGRERFSGRRGYNPGGVRVEKWKHDLFDEANKSPSPKNEEDQIAKVEALLSS